MKNVFSHSEDDIIGVEMLNSKYFHLSSFFLVYYPTKETYNHITNVDNDSLKHLSYYLTIISVYTEHGSIYTFYVGLLTGRYISEIFLLQLVLSRIYDIFYVKN